MRKLSSSLVALVAFLSMTVQGTEAQDAFRTGATVPVFHPDSATMDFLHALSIRVRNDWQTQGSPALPGVEIKFAKGHHRVRLPSWQPSPDEPPLNKLAGKRAVKIVESAISEEPPSGTKPFEVWVRFDKPDVRPHDVETQKPNDPTDIDFGPYIAELGRKVKSNWNLEHRPVSEARSVIDFKIQLDGSVTEAKLGKASGIPELDQSALNAVMASSPFRPLPSGSPSLVDFNYEIHYQPLSKRKPVFVIRTGSNVIGAEPLM